MLTNGATSRVPPTAIWANDLGASVLVGNSLSSIAAPRREGEMLPKSVYLYRWGVRHRIRKVDSRCELELEL